jgi:hypothetical protein
MAYALVFAAGFAVGSAVGFAVGGYRVIRAIAEPRSDS